MDLSRSSSAEYLRDSGMYPRTYKVGNELDNLLIENENLISRSKPILKKVFEKLAIREKAIFLSDRNGYLINLVGEIDVLQWFIEQGIKLGTQMSMEGCGNSAIGLALKTGKISIVNTDQHDCEALKKWTCIAAPIEFADELRGVVCISLQIDEKINRCKIIVELISDFVASLLMQDVKATADKKTFFGALILDNRFGLTPREIEVLYQLRLGVPMSELPGKLLLSVNTVKSHLKNIYTKLGVHSLHQCLRVIEDILDQI